MLSIVKHHYLIQEHFGKWSSILILSTYLISCGIINYDKTDNIISREISGKSFVTKVDSVLLDTCGRTVTSAILYRYAQNRCIPSSPSDALKIKYEDRCLSKRYYNWSCYFETIRLVPQGAKITVVKIVDIGGGEGGRRWGVYAKLDDDSMLFELSPQWIIPYFVVDGPPEANPDYLELE